MPEVSGDMLGSGLGGQGVEPPVRENWRLSPVMGGIKVRLGKDSII